MTSQGYIASQACEIAGISYRQLDYWDKSGLVSPSIRAAEGTGSARLYSFNDLVALRVVRRLKEGGIPLQTIRKAVKFLRDNLPSMYNPLSELTLVTNGRSIFALCINERQLIDTLKEGQLAFAVALQDIVVDLQGQLQELTPAPLQVVRRRRHAKGGEKDSH